MYAGALAHTSHRPSSTQTLTLSITTSGAAVCINSIPQAHAVHVPEHSATRPSTRRGAGWHESGTQNAIISSRCQTAARSAVMPGSLPSHGHGRSPAAARGERYAVHQPQSRAMRGLPVWSAADAPDKMFTGPPPAAAASGRRLASAGDAIKGRIPMEEVLRITGHSLYGSKPSCHLTELLWQDYA